ncbi:hypothetical protein [Herpetosiphon giganteus]|uniref:hypothetical protein n=1 Tax=Herpetosiphon giganteus TaxID=2029754 RepID=UPI00195DBDF3|nr:hypothetical protein [Herpetosiphon giganteus]MBM7843431.1 hypothetical protein [Herpetosiphon giganteus]
MNYVFVLLLAVVLLQGCDSTPQSSIPQESVLATATIMQAKLLPSATPVQATLTQPTPTEEEWYEYRGCETLDHPVYPQRLLYPDYSNLTQTETPTDIAAIRHTTFSSSAPSATILAWYREQALAAAWQEKQFSATTSRYSYTANGVCGPAFGMTITVTDDAAGSMVSITREISGPFSVKNWPQD